MSTPITYRHLLIDRYRALFDRVPDSAGSILDIGCGNAVFTQWFARKAPFVVGVDHNAANLSGPAREFPAIHLTAVAAEALPFPDGAFDVVVMSDVLEHVDNDRAALAEALRVVAPNGLLLVSLPNRGPFQCLDGDNVINRLVWMISRLRIPRGRAADGSRRHFFDGFRFVRHRHYSLRDLREILPGDARVRDTAYGGTLLWPLCYLLEKAAEVFLKWSIVDSDYRLLRRLRGLDFRISLGPLSYNLLVAVEKVSG